MSSLIVEIVQIDDVFNHPNADRLDVAVIKGWHAIIGRNQYKAGDLVVYIPPDSIIPSSLIEQYNLEYLRKDGRVKTVKLRGYISQGLVLNIPDGVARKVGTDVAKVMGITKYEPPAPSYQQAGGKKTGRNNPNPFFQKYTGLENIKNFNDVFKEGDMVVITEKIHGTNWRAGRLPRLERTGWDRAMAFVKKMFGKYDPYEFVYGSHNVQLSYTGKSWYGEDVYGRIAKKYKMADIVPNDYIVYGEVYGNKIQDLNYGLDDIDLVVFDVKFKGEYLPYEEKLKFCQERNLPMAPVLYIGEWKPDLIEKYTVGNSIIAPNQIREGFVTTDYNETNHPRIGRKILKSISPDYATRNNGTEYH